MIIRLGDIELFYETQGSGVPCLIPAQCNQRTVEFMLSQNLRQHFEFVFCHPRGTGKSSPYQVESIDIACFVEDLDTVRKDLGYERVALLGWTTYGLMTMQYALSHHEAISHLILAGTTPKRSAVPGWENEYWHTFASDERKNFYQKRLEQFQKESPELTPEQRIDRWSWVANPFFWYEYKNDYSSLFREMKWDITYMEHWFNDIVPNLDFTSQLESITCPVFLAHGRYDFWEPYTVWELDRFHDVEFHLFERSGHCPMYEEQELFDQRLLAWLKRKS